MAPGGSAIRKYAFLSLAAVFITATALIPATEAASITAAVYKPAIGGSRPDNFIVNDPDYPINVTIYLSQALPENINGFNLDKLVKVYVRIGGHFKTVRILSWSATTLSFDLFPEYKLLQHVGSPVQIKVHADGADSPVYSIPVIAPPAKPPTIVSLNPRNFPVTKHVSNNNPPDFSLRATHMDTSKSTRVLVDGVTCSIGLIHRDSGDIIAYMPPQFLKTAGRHRVQVENRVGKSKPVYIMVGHFKIPGKGISHIGIKPQKPYSESKPSTMTASRQHATSMPAPPPKPMRPGSMQPGARLKMPAANVRVLGERTVVDQSCRDTHKLIVVDATVRNDGGPLGVHKWELYVMEGGGADLSSGGVWVPPLAPRAEAHVSIPVLVLKSHIAQLPGTHWLKLISQGGGHKATTALSPITLARGICQPQMHMRSPAGMHLKTNRGYPPSPCVGAKCQQASPKLNPQPEPPSAKPRMQLPASMLTR